MENALKNVSAVSPRMEWKAIDWKKVNEYVKKLRQRIFRAEQLGQHRKVRKLQRLMMRSRANLLISIRKVTQENSGKRTAGVDGYKALTGTEREELYEQMKKYNLRSVKVKPVRRTYIDLSTVFWTIFSFPIKIYNLFKSATGIVSLQPKFVKGRDERTTPPLTNFVLRDERQLADLDQIMPFVWRKVIKAAMNPNVVVPVDIIKPV